MKINKLLFGYLLVNIFVLFISCSSDEDEEYKKTRVLNVEQAGSLPDLLPLNEKNIIERLVLSGPLNGTDIKYIRQMNQLKYLDMGNVNIVAGGEPYYILGSYVYYTSDDEMGEYMFHSKNIEHIILPSSIYKIDNSVIYYSNLIVAGNVFLAINNNNYYRTIDGVLYTNNGNESELVTYAKYQAKEFTVPDFVKIIPDEAFANCEYLESLKLSDNVEVIGWASFSGCTSLKNVVLSKQLKTIGEAAFWNCKALETITFPEKIEEIGSGVFLGCTSLKEIHLESTTPPKLRSNFHLNTDTKVFIPKGSLLNYAKANDYYYWEYLYEQGRLFEE